MSTTSSITPEAQALIAEEEAILAQVVATLKNQRSQDISKFHRETERARALTSQLIQTQRVEDKVQLVSDEAVSHELSDKKKRDVSTIESLLKKPYFARIELEEIGDDGRERRIEYKLGLAANTDCRIVDWRKAPIAKLYYEYKEGDDYSEQIQNRERNGRVVVRHTLDIEGNEIKRLTCRYGTFEKSEKGWSQLASGGARPRRSAGELPDVLSLITADQFRTITEDAETAILIQGIAGSGKTTVALHRLAWLLHHENSPLKPHESIVIVLSQALKNYVAQTLPKMEVHGVRVGTFTEFAAETLRNHLPHLFSGREAKRPVGPTPRSIDRLKRSMALLQVLEQYGHTYAQRTSWSSFEKDLLSVLSQPQAIVAADETGLINAALVKEAYDRTALNLAEGVLDVADDALLLRLMELKHGAITLRGGSSGKLGHIVVDEVQDASPVELACVVGAVTATKHLTIVGDVSQKMDDTHVFSSWEKLRERWAFKEAMSKYISLTISFRSTLPIMRLADHLQQRELVSEGRPGRVPIWFRCRKESDAVSVMRDWLSKAQEKYPGYLTAVLCKDTSQAKYLVSLLAPTFGNAVRLGDEYSFSFDEGIIVAPIRTVKGLEFTNVLLWNPSHQDYPDTQESRNALYVAVTRAEENLCMVTHTRPTTLLPPFSSPLIRAIDMTPEEEEKSSNA